MKKSYMLWDTPLKDQIWCNCTANCDYKNGTCKTDGACMKTILVEQQEFIINYSCVDAAAALTCAPPTKEDKGMSIGCCRNYNFCNKNLSITYPKGSLPDDTNGARLYVIVGSIFFMALLAALLACYFLYRRRITCRRKKEKSFPPIFTVDEPLMNDVNRPIEMINDIGLPVNITIGEEGANYTSGSGAGMPSLVCRTIARQIRLQTSIGKGSFGEVWLADWHGENVAVKMFLSRDEKSWFREVQIYETNLLRHENVLRYIAADYKDGGISTQLFLITEYHANGSLYDYLNANTVDEGDVCKLVGSIARGLAFLHTEIRSTRLKPAIAHRDLKSKNILVKDDGTCCIADLGLAVRYYSTTHSLDIPTNNKVGTKRYLAPEVLDDSINLSHFDNYRRGDMYAFGLVMWEICRRTRTEDVSASSYEIPYFEYVPPDPTLEEMRMCVCEQGKRPSIEANWMKSQLLAKIVELMRECWTGNSSARLTATRVKRSINTLLRLSSDQDALDEDLTVVTT